MTKTDPKTFEQLQQEASDHWKVATAGHASKMQTTQEQIASAPDVLNAPKIGSQWANELVICRCGGWVYTVSRYACINGQKYRTEVVCMKCQSRNTWDFGLNKWLS